MVRIGSLYPESVYVYSAFHTTHTLFDHHRHSWDLFSETCNYSWSQHNAVLIEA